jgi:elongation factor 1-alpha
MKKHKQVTKSINLIILGDVDSGRSTTIGHLIYELGFQENAIKANEKEAQEIGMENPKLRWILEKMKTEKELDTLDDSFKYTFQIENTLFTVVDVSGHRHFVKNLISGTSRADAAILVVSAAPGEFEKMFVKMGLFEIRLF